MAKRKILQYTLSREEQNEMLKANHDSLHQLEDTLDNLVYRNYDGTEISRQCVTPFDINGVEIRVGCTLAFGVNDKAFGAKVQLGIVEDIEIPSGRGYGYYTRKLKVREINEGRLYTLPYPKSHMVLRNYTY